MDNELCYYYLVTEQGILYVSAVLFGTCNPDLCANNFPMVMTCYIFTIFKGKENLIS